MGGWPQFLAWAWGCGVQEHRKGKRQCSGYTECSEEVTSRCRRLREG